jgi:hypothetical protein
MKRKHANHKAKVKTSDGDTVLHSGVVIQDKIITGHDPDAPEPEKKLTGNEKTDLSKIGPGGEVKEIKTGEQLYQGWLTGSATAAATGEKVSIKWKQEHPTTKYGCFMSFLSYHPSAIFDTFEIDATNTEDNTLRTYLEK